MREANCSTAECVAPPDRRQEMESKALRVLQLGSGNLFGGIEVCQRTLAKYRDACPAMEQEYGYCFEGKAAEELRALGVPVHVLGAVRYSRPWTIASAHRALRRVVKDRAFDVVICHELWVYGIFAPALRRAGLPLVLWLHDRHGSGGVLEYLARRTPPDFALLNSRWSAEGMSSFLPTVPNQVLYCPVEGDGSVSQERRAQLRRQFQTDDNAVVILQVGRWEPHKGHLCHLESLARLRDLPTWVCWQVGAPQRASEQAYFDEVRALAGRLQIADRIRFLGWQPDLAGIRAAADIYCQPNMQPEPFGLTLVEALSAGLPVVASAEAGPLEIVTSECGILVPPGDAESLAAALSRLIADPAERARLSANGRQQAEELSNPAQQLQRLADNLVHDLRPPSPMIAPTTRAGSRPPRWASAARRMMTMLPFGRYRLLHAMSGSSAGPFWTKTPPCTGGFEFLCDLRDTISREVCFAGRYESQETFLLYDELRPGSTFVDVGANWGYFSLLAAGRVGPSGTVVSLEPDTRLFELLQQNVGRNGFRCVRALPIAAGAESGRCSLLGFEPANGNWGVSRLMPHGPYESDACQEVATASLDDVLDELGVLNVDLLKMDIEGAEGLALTGMKRGLADGRYRCLLLELHPQLLVNWGYSAETILQDLANLGYRICRIDHSRQTSRRAAYAARLSSREVLLPYRAGDALDSWPHFFCTLARPRLN